MDETPLCIEADQREACEDSKQQDLQYLSSSKGVNEGVRDNIEQEVHNAEFPARARILADGPGIEGVWIDVHAPARLKDGSNDEPDPKCKSRDHLKIEQCLETDASQFARVSNICDPSDDAEEDDRRDHHADKLDKSVAKRFHRLCECGKE